MSLLRQPFLYGFLALTFAAAGCASPTPPPQPVANDELPVTWSSPIVSGAEVWPDAEWWRAFGSPELDRLIATARTNNLDLAAAAARILQVEAQVQIERAALFPTISLGTSAQAQGAVERGASGAFALFGIGAQASYETDFWGLARSNVRAAEARLGSTKYTQEVVALTVTSAVATSFLDVLLLRQRLAIARQNLETAQRILSAIEHRAAGGLSSPLELAQQQALVAGQQAVIPPLEQAERQATYTIALLLGRSPEGFEVGAQDPGRIAVPVVAPGLPSELLRRRPDVAAAEAGLVAARANVDAARAAFLPAIVLTGNAGLASGALSVATDNLAGGGVSAAAGGIGLVSVIGASLIQTIFDGGRREGVRNLAAAEEQELIAGYRSAVFNAFADVETTLGQLGALSDQERFKADQVDRASRAFSIAEVQFREGLIDVLSLLQTQQALFTAQDELAQIRLARMQATIGLYKALGGGWESVPGTTAMANERQ